MCEECEIDCKCPCVWIHDMVDIRVGNMQCSPDGCDFCQHVKKKTDSFKLKSIGD